MPASFKTFFSVSDNLTASLSDTVMKMLTDGFGGFGGAGGIGGSGVGGIGR